MTMQSQSFSACHSTRSFHAVTALTELGAGFSLILVPSTSILFLTGTPLVDGAVLTISRICGAALLALGIACWLARDDTQSRSSAGLMLAMLIYDFLIVGMLAYCGIGLGIYGVGLWPGVILHSLMGFWCAACLRRGRDA